jgi:hypothetical protein
MAESSFRLKRNTSLRQPRNFSAFLDTTL